MMDVASVACVAGSLRGVTTKRQGGKWGDNLSPPPLPSPSLFFYSFSATVYLDLKNFKGFKNVGS